MEQYEEIKDELRKDLNNLQQNVEQRSTFHSDMWRMSVKRYSSYLYWRNSVSAVLLVVIIAASNLVLISEKWPWWLLTAIDLFLSVIVVDSLIITNGLRKANVYSHEGLLSLRECIQRSSKYSKRKHIIIKIVGSLLIVSTIAYIYLYHHDLFVPTLFGVIISFLVSRKTVKRNRKHYNDLGEEIDELLKE